MVSRSKYLSSIFYLLCLPLVMCSQEGNQPPVYLSGSNRLEYSPDSQGNRVPDFSYCGYQSGGKPIPDIPVMAFVPAREGDATIIIQSAIDYVASLPAGEDGFRGAVLLDAGTFSVHGRLTIPSSGIVLRGSGSGKDGTVVIASGRHRQTLIRICGVDDRKTSGDYPVLDHYVPVNSRQLKVGKNHPFKTGDKVLIHRPATPEWISELGMESFGGETSWVGWKPGQHDLYWDRQITGTDDVTITLDVPITTALESRFGGGTVAAYAWPGRIDQVGIENLSLQSAFDPDYPKDEDHCWMAITIENASNAWVRRINFIHFAGSAVAVYGSASKVTVEDCISLDPVSEIGGMRRQTFYSAGQQTLFQRCFAEHGIHDFSVGFCAPGPNAFVQCESHLPFSYSGSVGSWASGVLFDGVQIDGNALSFKNRGQEGRGTGWSAANSMFWQCSAALIECYSPPGAVNWAFGSWSQFAGDGLWGNSNTFVKPYSLYYAQLADRLGHAVPGLANLFPYQTEPSSSPSVEEASRLTDLSSEPPLLLSDWIRQASQREPIPLDHTDAKIFDEPVPKTGKAGKKPLPVSVSNGWLVNEEGILTGTGLSVQWWRGSLDPVTVRKAIPHITRFVPGRTGTGFTDDLDELTDRMVSNHQVYIEHNYGLWYDRRRDDHERVRRMDGMVWAPFYELPFARSGQGTAWDGLSLYDLTRYNQWYWSRLSQFASLADRKGLVLIHQNYFQHNILEAGAHWVDFPWRPANNINKTGFPEPPPFAGNKRIFMDNQFYDINHPVRRQLHEQYIRKCLDNFSDNTNVIQLTSAEYTGPLHFVEFWVDVISEWEQETGKNALVGLSATKDVQDAILDDPARSSRIDIIDIRYWHYRKDGSLYAPEGGRHLAPRQYARLVKPGSVSFEQAYRAVREYREKYPGKPVIFSYPGGEQFGWAVFMAGGSLANIPVVADPDFLRDAVSMSPSDLDGDNAGQYTLGNANKGYIAYLLSDYIELDLSGVEGTFQVHWIDPVSGKITRGKNTIEGGKKIRLKSEQTAPVVVWLKKLR